MRLWRVGHEWVNLCVDAALIVSLIVFLVAGARCIGGLLPFLLRLAYFAAAALIWLALTVRWSTVERLHFIARS